MAGTWARSWRGRTVRVGLAALAVAHLVWGVWALGWPYHFFHTFPGWGHHWTAAYPPYNEHLVVDLGTTFTTLGVLLSWPVVRPDPRLARLALAVFAVFDVIHLGFHLRHQGHLGQGDWVVSLATLVAGVAVSIGLLVMTRGGGNTGERAEEA